MYKKSTQVPNVLLDYHLKTLTENELKLVLVIIRQTSGWVDKHTGRRKSQDRLSQSQFVAKTGLCKRAISLGLQSLVSKGLIAVFDQFGNSLLISLERKGVSKLYYSFRLVHFLPPTSADNVAEPANKSTLYKINYTKLNETKLKERSNGLISVGEAIAKMTY